MKNILKKGFSLALLSLLICIGFNGCESNEVLDSIENTKQTAQIASDSSHILFSQQSIPVYNFDWDNVDWMPTPPGQSRIFPPWVGQGSLLSFYGLDILNDHKASDGWILVYNTFDPNASGPISNPYFVLYNKYRGLMRIYLYLTTQGFATSSYLQDCISISSSNSSSLLNFLGQDMVDATVNQKIYTQNQSAPSDGSKPLASNRWYMMQYEMAYDPSLSQISTNNIALNWYVNYCDISSVSLGGTANGALTGTIGATSTSFSNILSEFSSKGTAVGVGVLAGVGKEIIDSNTINATTGENKLGLPKDLFKNVAASVAKAYSNLPGAAIDLLSTVFGGSSNGPTPISLNLKVNIDLKGSISNSGALISSITFPVPGTQGNPAEGYVPLYNQALGVVNFNGKPTIQTKVVASEVQGDDPYDGTKYTNISYTLTFPTSVDYSSYLLINPEVRQIANVVIEKQDIFLVVGSNNYVFNPTVNYWEEGYSSQYIQLPQEIRYNNIGVRFTIRINPKNGAPSSVIIKSFYLQENRTVINGWLTPRMGW